MSHYFAIVLVPEGTEDIEHAVAELMEPHRETHDEATDTTSGFWDWYRIGGRWDGIVQGVDRGQECVRCAADALSCHYSHEHEQAKWNVQAVAELGEVKVFTVVAPDLVRHREGYVGRDVEGTDKYGFLVDNDWPRTLGTILLAHRDHVGVGVDYHS